MKRDRFLLKPVILNGLKWLISFLVSVVATMLFLLVLALVQKRFRFEERIVRLVLMVAISLASGMCAYVYRKLSKIKGYICGIITAVIFSIIKLIMSLSCGGVGRENLFIYACILCASLIGGIMSANRNKKIKW